MHGAGLAAPGQGRYRASAAGLIARNQHLTFQVQISGEVDQSAGMLDEEAKEKGYALMCVAEPQSDCRIKVIEEVCPSCPALSHLRMPSALAGAVLCSAERSLLA